MKKLIRNYMINLYLHVQENTIHTSYTNKKIEKSIKKRENISTYLIINSKKIKSNLAPLRFWKKYNKILIDLYHILAIALFFIYLFFFL